MARLGSGGSGRRRGAVAALLLLLAAAGAAAAAPDGRTGAGSCWALGLHACGFNCAAPKSNLPMHCRTNGGPAAPPDHAPIGGASAGERQCHVPAAAAAGGAGHRPGVAAVRQLLEHAELRAVQEIRGLHQLVSGCKGGARLPTGRSPPRRPALILLSWLPPLPPATASRAMPQPKWPTGFISAPRRQLLSTRRRQPPRRHCRRPPALSSPQAARRPPRSRRPTATAARRCNRRLAASAG